MCKVNEMGTAIDRCGFMACLIDQACVLAGNSVILQAKVELLEQDIADRKNEREFVGAHLESWSKRFEAIRVTLQQYADQGDIDPEDSTLFQFLADEFDLEYMEEVNVTITIEVGATITKPKGQDVHYHDFDIDSLDISANERDWEIDLGDANITDVAE